MVDQTEQYKINKKNGKLAEDAFRNWADKQEIAFLFIEQGRQTKSKVLKDVFKTKRPDYIILVPKIGMMIVDVKHRMPNAQGQFEFKADNIEQYFNLQKHFNFKVWLAITSETKNPDVWYWISVTYLHEKNKDRISGGAKFRILPEECNRISEDDDLGAVINKILQKK